MNWEIIQTNMGVQVKSDNPDLDAYFHSIAGKIELFEYVVNRIGISFNYSSLTYPSDLDEYDINTSEIAIPNGHVRVGNSWNDEYVVILEAVFDEILLKLSLKLLEFHKNNDVLRQDWKVKMIEGINKLKNKIAKGYLFE